MFVMRINGARRKGSGIDVVGEGCLSMSSRGVRMGIDTAEQLHCVGNKRGFIELIWLFL